MLPYLLSLADTWCSVKDLLVSKIQSPLSCPNKMALRTTAALRCALRTAFVLWINNLMKKSACKQLKLLFKKKFPLLVFSKPGVIPSVDSKTFCYVMLKT